jgi:hypothetical protein
MVLGLSLAQTRECASALSHCEKALEQQALETSPAEKYATERAWESAAKTLRRTPGKKPAPEKTWAAIFSNASACAVTMCTNSGLVEGSHLKRARCLCITKLIFSVKHQKKFRGN